MLFLLLDPIVLLDELPFFFFFIFLALLLLLFEENPEELGDDGLLLEVTEDGFDGPPGEVGLGPLPGVDGIGGLADDGSVGAGWLTGVGSAGVGGLTGVSTVGIDGTLTGAAAVGMGNVGPFTGAGGSSVGTLTGPSIGGDTGARAVIEVKLANATLLSASCNAFNCATKIVPFIFNEVCRSCSKAAELRPLCVVFALI